jgi:putative phosphoserine phosphatase/1-acylglycerol-3-phosphate O-acyltransferase
LTALGVNLNVLGRENLTAERPAVFIFNHRNNFDPIITSALVRDNFTGVGKKELENDPIVGTLGRLMDGVFIDRDDNKSAVESLRKVEDLARKGLSVVIAPEGTRLDTTEVGPFKKGPFRLAMAAGIPIVPVIIRNAEVIAARNSSTAHPGTVDIAVFAPVSVADWTVDDLDERIAGIRRLYLDTLKNWPTDRLPDITPYLKPAVANAPAGRATPRKAAEKAAPGKAAPRKAAPRKAAPRKAAPRKAAPRKAAEKVSDEPADSAPVKKTAAKGAPTRDTTRGRR